MSAPTEPLAVAGPATVGTPWERFLAGQRRRAGKLDASGLWTCPSCGRQTLFVSVESGQLNIQCTRGCLHSTIMRALRLELADLIPGLAELVREEANGHAGIDLALLGFSGERLRATRERPVRESPLPGFLDPEPHLHVVLGKAKTGKTTLLLALAQAWAEASEPWPSARPLPGGRVLVISREQPVARLDAVLRRLARHGGRGDSTTWEDRITLIGRDPALAPEAKTLLTLDEEGRRTLRAGLASARDDGDPFSLVVLDSLSRLKPPGVEERDNDALSAWLDQLEEIACTFGVYVMLVHHVGHTADDGRKEARSAGRGASSISAVAQVVWLLERVANPHQRRLEVDGNAILLAEHHLEVADETADAGEIRYFRPCDPLADYQPTEYLRAEEEPISMRELARRIDGKDEGDPSGASTRLASQLVGHWNRNRLIDVSPGGKGKKTLIKLRRSAES